MDIKYKNKNILKVCTNADVARKAYGKDMAEKIHMRIDQIAAADTVEELVMYRIGRCHPLHGDKNGKYAVDLAQPYRMIFAKIGKKFRLWRYRKLLITINMFRE